MREDAKGSIFSPSSNAGFFGSEDRAFEGENGEKSNRTPDDGKNVARDSLKKVVI